MFTYVLGHSKKSREESNIVIYLQSFLPTKSLTCSVWRGIHQIVVLNPLCIKNTDTRAQSQSLIMLNWNGILSLTFFKDSPGNYCPSKVENLCLRPSIATVRSLASDILQPLRLTTFSRTDMKSAPLELLVFSMWWNEALTSTSCTSSQSQFTACDKTWMLFASFPAPPFEKMLLSTGHPGFQCPLHVNSQEQQN